MGEHLAGVPREQGEQPKLDRREVDRLAVDDHLVARVIDPDRADLDRGIIGLVCWPRDAAQRDTDPREQLARAERLGQVVIGAGVERGDLVVLRDRAPTAR